MSDRRADGRMKSFIEVPILAFWDGTLIVSKRNVHPNYTKKGAYKKSRFNRPASSQLDRNNVIDFFEVIFGEGRKFLRPLCRRNKNNTNKRNIKLLLLY